MESKLVAESLAVMAVIFEKRLTKEAVDMMIKDLSDFSEKEVIAALDLCRKDMPRFPTISEIIKRIPAKETNPSEIVGKILMAVELHGYCSPKKAREFMGETGWRAVNYFGGWQSICDYPASSGMALRSQLRNCVIDAIEARATSPELFIEETNNWRGGTLQQIDFQKMLEEISK